MTTFKLNGKEYNYNRLANGQIVIDNKTPDRFVSELKKERFENKYGRQLSLFEKPKQ